MSDRPTTLPAGKGSYRAWLIERSHYGRGKPYFSFRRKEGGFLLILFGWWFDVGRG